MPSYVAETDEDWAEILNGEWMNRQCEPLVAEPVSRSLTALSPTSGSLGSNRMAPSAATKVVAQQAFVLRLDTERKCK